jgi:hypothetical protein
MALIDPAMGVLSAIAWFRQLSLCRFGGLCEHGAVPKRLIRGVIKAVAGIAVVVFILARFTTNINIVELAQALAIRPSALLSKIQ